MSSEPPDRERRARPQGSKALALGGAYVVLLVALLGVLLLARSDPSSLRLTLIFIGFAIVTVLVTVRTLRDR